MDQEAQCLIQRRVRQGLLDCPLLRRPILKSRQAIEVLPQHIRAQAAGKQAPTGGLGLVLPGQGFQGVDACLLPLQLRPAAALGRGSGEEGQRVFRPPDRQQSPGDAGDDARGCYLGVYEAM